MLVATGGGAAGVWTGAAADEKGEALVVGASLWTDDGPKKVAGAVGAVVVRAEP